jgi:phage shock protein A
MFKRLANLWKGFLSLWISDIEKEHPEIAYENAINSMVAKYSKLKTATAGIIRRREDIDERYKRATAELAQTEAELDTAVSTNQDDLALILIQKKNQLTTDVTELKTEMEQAKNDADSAKTSLLGVQSEIRKLQGERDSMLKSRRSTTCASTSRPPLPKRTWGRSFQNPRLTRVWLRSARRPATFKPNNNWPS